jgi:hypothetical protein
LKVVVVVAAAAVVTAVLVVVLERDVQFRFFLENYHLNHNTIVVI